MVEAKIEAPLSRTPTSEAPGYFDRLTNSSPYSPDLSANSSKLHDTNNLATPLASPSHFGFSATNNRVVPHFLPGNASLDMSETSKPDPSKAGSSSYRRRPRSQQLGSQRSPGQLQAHSPSSQGYVTSSSNTSENPHNIPHPELQGSPIHYASAAVHYGQRSGFVGQYMMPTQPSPMNMVHSPPYAFSHVYHPMATDTNTMMSQQNIHAMLQPHTSVFHYQGHSTDGTSPSHSPFGTGSHNSPIYPSHLQNPPSSSTSPGQSRALTPSYISPTPFHSLQYPQTMSSPPYGYPPSYPPSPLYQPQYGHLSFPQHYGRTGETEPQGTWYYLPHNHAPGPQQQYEAGPSYQGHYGVGYPQTSTGGDGGYSGSGASSSQSQTVYLGFPRHHPPHAHPQPPSTSSDNQSPRFESPSASGIGPPPEPRGSEMGLNSESSESVGHAPQAAQRPVIRRSYHPNPPVHRSEWVMWAGNVPSDATHDELWRFFNTPSKSEPEEDTGVMSIFLISRSSCAFVNYQTEEFLQSAITRFNGIPLRPNDSRCPRLVCRVRKKDDDLKAGVGGQRGMGMHTRWIKEQKGKGKEVASASEPSDLSASEISLSPTSVSERMAHAISNLSFSSDEEGKKMSSHKHSGSPASYTSTTSSFLSKNFPKRYFILKSLTQEDLDISVERGLWATQKHNEEILDQAYRSSKEVHLIFSVNKSGEFYGYAKMAGPVRRGEQRVSWASRPPSSRAALANTPTTFTPASPMRVLSPSDQRFVDNSPMPINPIRTGLSVEGGSSQVQPRQITSHSRLRHSAPALLGEPYRLPTVPTPPALLSTERAGKNKFNVSTNPRAYAAVPERFSLDSSAPFRAMRSHQDSGSSAGSGSAPSVPSLHSVQEEGVEAEGDRHRIDATPDGYDGEKDDRETAPEDSGIVGEDALQESRPAEEESWGDTFAVMWLCTDRVPFHRVKHLRNPWNRDREIKISRDGTELEPSVGQRLLDEWEKLSDPQLPPSVGAGKPVTIRSTAASKKPLQALEEEMGGPGSGVGGGSKGL